MQPIKILVVIIGTLIMSSCAILETETYTTGQLQARQLLENNREADIFMFDDIVYQKIGSAEKMKDTIQDRVGIITTNYHRGEKFENAMATKIAIGAEIYTKYANSSVRIVKVNDEWFEYHSLPEG